MAAKPGSWADLFAPGRDLNSALPAVLRALESEHAAGGSPASFTALASAISSALSPTQLKPSRILLAESALLAALDMQFPAEVEAPLMGDLVVRSISGCVAARWPLVAGLAVRCLCSMAAASAGHQGTKEDRTEKQTWTRKVVPQLRTLLESYPKSFQVQQLVCDGCCVLLLSGRLNLGGNLSALWPLLWPLVVHPRRQVASAASLALCRLTWLLRTTAEADAQAPTAERAMLTACAELSTIFTTAVVPKMTDASSHVASLQCVRLLELLRDLVRYSRSRPTDTPARRERKEAEESLIVLPVAKLMATIELLLASLIQTTAVATKVLAASSAPTGQLVAKSLDLLSAIVEVSGSAALVFSAQLRRWLELLADWSPKTHVGHSKVVLSFVLNLERSAPAILLRKPLLQRLCNYSLEAMSYEIGLAGRAATSSAKSPSRKRKAEALQEAAEFVQPSFPVACRALARLLERGGALLEQSMVAKICEEVVQSVWHGLLRPQAVTGKELDRCLVYKQICRTPEAVLGLLDVMKVLVEPRQLGAKPLAPSLLQALAAIVSTLQGAFERHALQGDDDEPASVRTKLRELADTIRFDRLGRPAEGKGISIQWPDIAPESHGPGKEGSDSRPPPRPETPAEASQPQSRATPERAPVPDPRPLEVAAVTPEGVLDGVEPMDTQPAEALPGVAEELLTDTLVEEMPTDTLVDTLPDDAKEVEIMETPEGQESTAAAATTALPVMASVEVKPDIDLPGEAFSTPLNADAADFETPMNSALSEEVATLPGLEEAAVSAVEAEKATTEEKLELFPTQGDRSPSPELCLDSPSE